MRTASPNIVGICPASRVRAGAFALWQRERIGAPIGVPLVRAIVEAQDADVRDEIRSNRGSELRLRLPAIALGA